MGHFPFKVYNIICALNSHLKSSKGCIITRSPLALILFKGLATKHTTVKWTIVINTSTPATEVKKYISRATVTILGRTMNNFYSSHIPINMSLIIYFCHVKNVQVLLVWRVATSEMLKSLHLHNGMEIMQQSRED